MWETASEILRSAKADNRPLRVYCDRSDHLNPSLITRKGKIVLVSRPEEADVLYLIGDNRIEIVFSAFFVFIVVVFYHHFLFCRAYIWSKRRRGVRQNRQDNKPILVEWNACNKGQSR